jgi:hypothetical protein
VAGAPPAAAAPPAVPPVTPHWTWIVPDFGHRLREERIFGDIFTLVGRQWYDETDHLIMTPSILLQQSN